MTGIVGNDVGAPPQAGSGHSAEPEPSSTVSAVPVSVPNAVSLEEFCARFKARMIARAGEVFSDGESIAEYANEAAPGYWEEGPGPFMETPEDCADIDISYWED